MNLIYRARFVRPCTEAAAREAVEGVNGGNVSNVRTADDGKNTTAWFSVTVKADMSDDIESAIDAELSDDSRVLEFSVTGDYSGELVST